MRRSFLLMTLYAYGEPFSNLITGFVCFLFFFSPDL